MHERARSESSGLWTAVQPDTSKLSKNVKTRENPRWGKRNLSMSSRAVGHVSNRSVLLSKAYWLILFIRV